MAVIGSPGVSTTALGLTLNWHRPVLLVDADPTGSSSVFAGYFQGAQEPTGGLINLALSLREGTLADALPRETLLLDPGAPAERSAWFLPGIRAHEQAPSLLPLWEPLTEQLRALDRNGQDVIVDAGRLGLAGWPQPLIAASDLTLLVTRSSLPALAGATSWAKTLRAQFAAVGGLSRLGGFLGARKPRKFESSGLRRGYRGSTAAIQSILGANQAALAPTNGGHA